MLYCVLELCAVICRCMWGMLRAVIGGGRGQWLGGHHGECGARAYNGGLGAEPPAGSRGRAESILVIGYPTEPANLAPVRENSMFCYGPLVSELEGPECMVPPTPSLGGTMGSPPAPPLMPSLHWDCVLKVISYTDHSDCCVTFGCILCCQPPAKTGIFAPGQNHEAALSHAEQFPATAADVQRVGKLDNRSADEAAVQHTLETVPWELSTVSSTLRLYRTLRDATWRHQLRSAQDRTERHTAASQPFQSTWSQLSDDSYCSETNGNVVATRDR